MSDFEKLYEILDAIMKGKHAAKDLKLLNVGSNGAREHHWRFRTLDGAVINISMECEP